MPDPCGAWTDGGERERLVDLHSRLIWAALATISEATRHDPFVLRELKRYFKEAIWAATEVRVTEKYDLRYVSAGVVAACREHGRLRTWMREQGKGPPSLNHEHVIPKALLNQRLLNAKTLGDVSQTLGLAIGCTVTEEEHERLHGASGSSWDRYAAAAVPVWDRLKGEWRADCGAAPVGPFD